MLIAILTFDGFNELDCMVPLNILSRQPGWRVRIASPSTRVTSMNGVTIEGGMPLAEARAADAIVIGSGVSTRQISEDSALLAQVQPDIDKQLVASQCSGALLLSKWGLLEKMPVCTDEVTRPWLEESGANVLEQPFFARGNIASAGGCLATHYLAGWLLARLAGLAAAERALRYVAPVGEKDVYVARAMGHIRPYVENASARTEALQSLAS